MSAPLTRAELLALPAVIDLATAARALGMGRTKAYELAQAGEFPAPSCGSATATASSPPRSCGSCG